MSDEEIDVQIRVFETFLPEIKLGQANWKILLDIVKQLKQQLDASIAETSQVDALREEEFEKRIEAEAQLTAAKPAIELYEAVREFKKYLANEINWCARNYDGNKGTPEGMFHKGTLKALIAAERKFIALAKQISGEGDNGNS